MKKELNNKNKIKSIIPILIFIYIITTIIVTMFSFSKYQLSKKAETKNRVASSIINLTSENSDLGIEINPVQNEKYTWNNRAWN